jgi:hypothetical protein
MMARLWPKVMDVLDDVLAYILTIVGILLSNYLPVLKVTGHVDLHIDPWRVGIASLVALLVVTKQESLGGLDKEASKAGRRRNFGQRMASALSHGIAWNQIVQLGG